MKKVVVELEWVLEIPEDAEDLTDAIGQAMDAHALRPFKDVVCEMRYIGSHEVNPWETQHWDPPESSR